MFHYIFKIAFSFWIMICLHTVIWHRRLIGLVDRVFANGLGDLGSISGRIIPKTLKNGT